MDRQLGPRRTERRVQVGSSPAPTCVHLTDTHTPPPTVLAAAPGLQLPPLPLLLLFLGAWRKPVDDAVPRAPRSHFTFPTACPDAMAAGWGQGWGALPASPPPYTHTHTYTASHPSLSLTHTHSLCIMPYLHTHTHTHTLPASPCPYTHTHIPRHQPHLQFLPSAHPPPIPGRSAGPVLRGSPWNVLDKASAGTSGACATLVANI